MKTPMHHSKSFLSQYRHIQDYLLNSKAAMQQSHSPLRDYGFSLLQWSSLFPDTAKAMECYTVTLPQLQNEMLQLYTALQQCIAAMPQRSLKIRNCKPAFPKSRFALRHCSLKMLRCKPARLLCIHSPPLRLSTGCGIVATSVGN